MNLTTTLKASLAVACVIAFAGCTDLKPIQAQIDDLKSQVGKLQSDVAKASSDAAAANSAAASAQSAASGRAEHREPGVVDLAGEFDGH
jgi:outer membrane murein-binding lipoprotein Lpp